MARQREKWVKAVLASALLAMSCARANDGDSGGVETRDIVFVSRDSTSAALKLFTIAPDGSQRRRLSHINEYSYDMPVWSPDRRWIAAVRWQTSDRRGTDLVLVRPTDGSDSVVAHFPGEAYFPDWSPDGGRIVLLAGGAYPAWAVTIVTLASGVVRALLPADTAVTRLMPTWTRDEALLVAENTKCRTRILRIDARSGQESLLLATDSIWLSAPAESPDGRDILLTGSRQSPCTPVQAQLPHLDQDVYVMNADGSHLRRLTHDPMMSNTARWRPDGSEIVFASDRHASRNDWATVWDSTELYVMRRDGSGIRRLTTNRLPDNHPHW